MYRLLMHFLVTRYSVSVPRTPVWLIVGPSLWALGLILLALLQPWVTLDEAFRDTQLIAFKLKDSNLIPLAGFVSNFGIMAWVAGGAIAGFTATMLEVGPFKGLLNALAMLTFCLALDDFFVLHERVGPRFFGINELAFFVAYAAAFLAILSRYRDALLQVFNHFAGSGPDVFRDQRAGRLLDFS